MERKTIDSNEIIKIVNSCFLDIILIEKLLSLIDY